MDANPTDPKNNSRRELPYLFLAAGCVFLVVSYIVGISDNPPGIVALLLGGFLVILGIFYRFRRPSKLTLGQELLYWSPRALTIMIALFTSMFALDVFGEARGFWETAGALFMHLIPVFLILIVLALSWRWEWIRGDHLHRPGSPVRCNDVGQTFSIVHLRPDRRTHSLDRGAILA